MIRIQVEVFAFFCDVITSMGAILIFLLTLSNLR